MNKIGLMLGIIVSLFIALIGCNSQIPEKYIGSWTVLEFHCEDLKIIPDSTAKVQFYPAMHLTERGHMVIAVAGDDEIPLSNYKIIQGISDSIVISHPQFPCMNGSAEIRIFQKEEHIFLEIRKGSYYLLGRQTGTQYQY